MKSKLVLASLALAALGGCKAPEKKVEVKTETTQPAKPAQPAATSSYTSVAVSDGGKISGTVTYTGTETDTAVTPTKDHEACGDAATPKPAHELVVDGDKHLRNVVVYIDGIKQGKQYSPESVTIDNENCMFQPHVAIGHQGQTVKAKNSDPVLHNTHLKLTNGTDVANIALPEEGQEIEKQLRKAGLTNVTCDVHEWMKAYIWVTDHPYAVVTGDDGSFELNEVPPGDYTVKFWHEKLGEKTATVTVAAGATADASQAY